MSKIAKNYQNSTFGSIYHHDNDEIFRNYDGSCNLSILLDDFRGFTFLLSMHISTKI